MPTFNLNGFRPEPDSPKHWGFEDKLRARMVQVTAGDVDLRPFTSPRHNQGGTSTCVAQATCKAFEIKRIMKHGHEAHVDLSRLAIYWFARNLMVPKETNKDDGTYISHAFDAMRRFGVPPESAHPWDPKAIYEAPSWDAMRKAYLSKIDSFYKIRSTGQKRVDMVVEALQANNPVVFGTNVDRSWNDYRKGQVLQAVSNGDATGRHATCIVGIKDGLFIGENSWGDDWGNEGFYLMDPSCIASDVTKDLWVPQAGFETYQERQG
jgi:C1A family cysteine protease